MHFPLKFAGSPLSTLAGNLKLSESSSSTLSSPQLPYPLSVYPVSLIHTLIQSTAAPSTARKGLESPSALPYRCSITPGFQHFTLLRPMTPNLFLFSHLSMLTNVPNVGDDTPLSSEKGITCTHKLISFLLKLGESIKSLGPSPEYVGAWFWLLLTSPFSFLYCSPAPSLLGALTMTLGFVSTFLLLSS